MLAIKNLRKTYGKRQVLEDLNLEIDTGQIYGLLGPNGAGKTTAINIICGLLDADRGTVEIDRQQLSAQTKKWLGVAPQENLLYSQLTCAENLAFFGKIYGLKGTQLTTAVTASLMAVNLLERKNSPVETLSGGMKRKINIAVALIHHPKVLILDEPTTGLDIEARYEIWQLILSLKAQGMTILLTTHLLDEAEKLCDRIGILKGGKIICQGSLERLKQLIQAREIVFMETEAESQAIARGKQLGFSHRYYGQELAFWLPENLELERILACFQGINITSLTKKAVSLEHIYLEVTAGNNN